MKTNAAKTTVSKVLTGKNESGQKKREHWNRITGRISRKDLNSLKYFSIYNSDVPDEQIINIDVDEKIEKKDSGLKRKSRWDLTPKGFLYQIKS